MNAKKLIFCSLVMTVMLAGCESGFMMSSESGWVSLFDGKSLSGWKASEKSESFVVRDGMIVVQGGRSHLFYVGPVEGADFEKFEFKADVMTTSGANSGIYFHTEYQETGWPAKGYECQVNSSHSDPKRTASLYGVENITDSPSKDNEWFTVHIIVQGRHIIHKVNDRVFVDYIEPEGFVAGDWPGRKLSSGTFALQGHDPESVVYYKNIRVKPLPGTCCKKKTQEEKKMVKAVVVTGGHGFEEAEFFEMFDGFDGIEYEHFVLKDDSEIFEDVEGWDYDVMVLYNMTQKISPKRQANFVKLLKDKGVGVVGVHHNLASFQEWDEYRKIIGGKYFLADTIDNGVPRKRGAWQHEVKLNVYVENGTHPVTKWLNDFEIIDETYKNFVVDEGSKVLLTTDDPKNEKQLCWVKQYGNSRVCYVQLGHGSSAYKDVNYRRLLSGAIKWCSPN